ncbi:Molybdopterin oxidoreductase [Sulfurovum sp. enrichment culture clone C5]|uniref:Molybdopterin oxidoreductase n=1 Tax=Sulfurovum sp. enrichment culture clone C5 TaxID=497650 RepID=A0A0S4XMF7_9BACT|nr:Molybdopterin oxidoreductase [Sulfurovum sp. enrichment culture clone C5]
MIYTTCALDCYDGCSIVYDNDKISGDKLHPVTQGALCANVNKNIFKEPRITTPMINGKAISMDEALEYIASVVDDKTLLWRGSGNVAVMQEVTNLLMGKIDGTITKGSLCDGAGEAGIIEGRGVNLTLPLEQIAKSEVVVIWGRDVTVTNRHILPFIKDKKIIVIDPIKTKIAKSAHLHIQLAPRSDLYLAVLLARFIFMEELHDKKWLDKFASDYEEYYDFVRTFRIKALLALIDTNLDTIGDMLSLIEGKKVVFLVGAGVQKYSIGNEVLRAIDAVAVLLGLFGKEGCGVSYLGDSKLGFKNPFVTEIKKVSKVDTPFDEFDSVIIQGGNPCESMPNTNEVINRLENVKNVIYFGLYENETSRRANVVIPAKNFFEKNDVRLSYGHSYVSKINKIKECDFGISEYDFVREIFKIKSFGGLESEEYYLNYWLDQCDKMGNIFISKAYRELPYENGFGKDEDEEFVFLDDHDDDFIERKKLKRPRGYKNILDKENSFWLVNSKSNDSLNTQFEKSNRVILHPDLGFCDDEEVMVSSEFGEIRLRIKNSVDIRIDCVKITANTIGINKLTPSIISNEGHNACYGEVKVSLSKVLI